MTAALAAALVTATAATAASAATPGSPAAAATVPSCSSANDSTAQTGALHSLANDRGVVVLTLDTSQNRLPASLQVGSWSVPVTWVPTAAANTWRTDGPIQLPALGTYSASVLAPVIGHPGMDTELYGTVDYTVQPVVRTARTDRTATDVDHRTATVSGTVLGRDPGTGQLHPYAGRATVSWQDPNDPENNTADTPLAAAGSFTIHASNRASGWYRAHHRASAAFQDQVTGAVRQSRTDSRITSAKITPQPVTKGRTLTVTGVLQHHTSAWKAYGGQRVAVLFRPVGSTTWTTVTTAVTSGTGHFTARATAKRDGVWVVSCAGNGTHFAGRSAQDFVDVR